MLGQSLAEVRDHAQPRDAALVVIVRVLMGADFLVNGLNWWVKLIDAYPSISDYAHRAPPADLVGAMIQTGVMFHLVKATELLAGVALLTNRFVPLMLVVVFPVTVPVFIVDVVLIHHLRGFIMGAGAFLMNVFLMLSYLGCYRPMLRSRASADWPPAPGSGLGTRGGVDVGHAAVVYRIPIAMLGVVAAAFGAIMVGWVATMIAEHFARL
jgi:hypothetical protein